MEPVFPFPLTLPDPARGTLTQALHRQLRDAIVSGQIAAGSVLPSTRRVADALQLARNTVIATYDLLIAEGYALPRRNAPPAVADLLGRQGRVRHAVLPRQQPSFGPAWLRLPPRESPSDVVAPSFRLGVPDHRHFPHAEWRRLTAREQRRLARQPFTYGPPTGMPALREAIARHVAFTRAVACTGDDVIVTAGAQQAFDLIARLLVTPGETRVAVEDPGYPPMRAAFGAAGAVVQGVPVDEQGLKVEVLHPDTDIVVVTPSHQSPTGVVLSTARRHALLAFAQEHGSVIIEDDYDSEFRFHGRPLDALQTLDLNACVLYVGTFSKSLFPSLRKGFIVAPAWAREALTTVKFFADSHCDVLTQMVLASFIEEGHLARHLRRMCTHYAVRRKELLAGLNDYLSDWLEPMPSEAGLHLAARIRDPRCAPLVYAAARKHLPGVQASQEYVISNAAPPAIIFGYGLVDIEAIGPALRAFHGALRR